MCDSRKGLKDKTKRELVELLLMEVEQWSGNAPLPEKQREQAAALLAALNDCRLWLAETHWLALCHLWLSRSPQPDLWLRDFWLGVVQQWQRFLAEDGFEPDSRPIPSSAPYRRRAPYTPPEAGHLPFGFVKPWV